MLGTTKTIPPTKSARFRELVAEYIGSTSGPGQQVVSAPFALPTGAKDDIVATSGGL